MMYSQSLEEQYILNYFGDKIGTFLDIGSNDGVTFSNTRALALRGWRGVLVEPSPKAFGRLKTLYNGQKGFYVYPFALSDRNGTAVLQESGALCSPSDVGLVSTFHQEEVDRFKRTVKYDSVEVKTFKWKTFLNRLKIKQFDFISLDIEGHELHVLPDIDLTKTELICIEHNGKENLKKDYLYYTSKYGLSKIIYESGENILIAR